MTQPPDDKLQRRTFLTLSLGWCSALFALGASLAAAGRFLVPNVLYEPNRRFKGLKPEDYPEGPTFLPDLRVFLFREGKKFRAVSAVCTHLGCTVKMITLGQPQSVQIKGQQVKEVREFHCPCHGSKYYGDGTNYAGPAPGPLARYLLRITPDDGQLIVNTAELVDHNFRLML